MRRKITEIGGDVPSNGASSALQTLQPYTVEVTIQGNADLLFHRWNCEEVEEKAKAAKGSKAKKTDNLDSYVYRDDQGNLALPGEYLRMSIVYAAKYKQDPRSPRKSAMDLYKAAIVPLTLYASLGMPSWDYEHKCRVVIQKNGITRTRPAIKSGWKATFLLNILLPEYVSENDLHEVISMAGRVTGVGDFRPTYGRFQIVHYQKLN